jgi:HTH-type transcriptional regulator/antitoxin HigA
MTLRYDRLDHFWFCLLHELAHVLLHIQENKDEFFIDDMSIAGLDGREAEADRCANDVLLPEATWTASAAAQDPTILNVGSLAAAVNRSPAIVAARMRFNTGNYRLLTHLVGTGQVRRRFPEAFLEVA